MNPRIQNPSDLEEPVILKECPRSLSGRRDYKFNSEGFQGVESASIVIYFLIPKIMKPQSMDKETN